MANQIKIIKGSKNEDTQKEITLAQGASLNIDDKTYTVDKIVKDEAGDFSVYVGDDAPKDQATGDTTDPNAEKESQNQEVLKLSARQKANVRF